MNNKSITKVYLKQIKNVFPVFSSQEKRFLADIQACISDYVEKNPDISYENLCEKFGRPTEVVYDYIATLDPDVVITRISYRKMLRRAIAIVLALAIALFGVVCTLSYMAYLDSINPVFTIQESETN